MRENKMATVLKLYGSVFENEMQLGQVMKVCEMQTVAFVYAD